MKLVDESIEAFCRSHSFPPSQVSEALAKYTLANVPCSIMLCGPLVGCFLGLMARTIGAKRALEVGCYTGYSALWMAENLPQNGEVVSLDINPDTAKVAQQFWSKSPHGKKIRLELGDARKTLETLKGPFDLVFIDANKEGYIHYAERALELLSSNGVIIADNCLYSGEVVEENLEGNALHIRKFDEWVAARSDLYQTLLPIRDGLFVLRKL